MKTLPKTDSGTDTIQFRGYQTSVTLDDFGVRFQTGRRETLDGSADVLTHEPLPVVDQDEIADPDADVPPNAVAREVAEALTDGDLANPLICWGVVCEWPKTDDEGEETGEVCGEVFDTPRSLNGHMRVHYDTEGEDDDEGDGGGTDTGESASSDTDEGGADETGGEGNAEDEPAESADTPPEADNSTEGE